MKIKVFCPNTNGKLEFTKDELEKMLNEAYQDGYRDGRYCYVSPWYCTTQISGNASTTTAATLNGYVDSTKATEVNLTDCTIATSAAVEDISSAGNAIQVHISDFLKD